MSVRNLDKIFRPQRIAVIGASDARGKVGHTVLRNLVGRGFEGAVYPVNPKREAVQGIQAYANVGHLPHPADLAIICTPATSVAEIVRQCGRAGVLGVVILSAGFREVGPAGAALEQAVQTAARESPGLRILGPNCLGFIMPSLGLNASFAAAMPQPGRIAFLSQSGALCTSVLDWAIEQEIGFSCFVSVGNTIDVTVSDLIDYFGADQHTESMILYLESLSSARQFMSAARAFARDKPLVVYKAGRFADSAKAAASHTGAMAGVDAVYEAAFERAGAVRVLEIDDVFDCAQLLAHSRLPRGPRLAIVTNAGGPGVMATDSLLARRGQLAALSSATVARLNDMLPSCWSHGNPIDVLGDADPPRFAQALSAAIDDPSVDAALAILTPQAMTDPTATAEAVGEIAKNAPKPVLAAWMGGLSIRDGGMRLSRANVPNYETPDHAVRAFMHLVSYAKNLQLLYETPHEETAVVDGKHQQLDALFEAYRCRGQAILSEVDSKAVLDGYGIATVPTRIARSADEAVQAAEALGYPVAVKILSPEITHKTDVGGVALNLANVAGVRIAFDEVVAAARRARPEAMIDGVTVEPMVAVAGGFEMIVGVKRDPVFGPVVLVGSGGVTAEVFQDRALGLPPLNDRLARHMLESLRSWPILQGFRGRPGINVDRMVDALIRFSHLVADRAEILEIDINPLLVTRDGVLALDARVVLDLNSIGKPTSPFAHLAIRPYPEEFVRAGTLVDGMPVVLRPIKPDDEPMWIRLLESCSMESLRARFRGLLAPCHETATRFCFPDYDREMTMVAEATPPEGPKAFLGLAQLAGDPDHREAEFAVMVSDAWQGRGLGTLLTTTCIDVARRWGIERIVAETEPSNRRMLAIFRKQDFSVRSTGDVIVVQRELT
ncbi:MAG TPA: bifunctional acetate--CoA ligase family protein/GNAT family N-acetyltransferase [Pirellulales bacterium]|nr:bifunctional acetate--CoA ligase family protein/GNAT family N-acetyltransferase [Pirellulales bacterium]